MSQSALANLALQRLYHLEKTHPQRIALTQPMGDGSLRDFTWAQVGDQVRRMAAYLQSQGWEPGSRVAILSKNCAWWMMSDLASGCRANRPERHNLRQLATPFPFRVDARVQHYPRPEYLSPTAPWGLR